MSGSADTPPSETSQPQAPQETQWVTTSDVSDAEFGAARDLIHDHCAKSLNMAIRESPSDGFAVASESPDGILCTIVVRHKVHPMYSGGRSVAIEVLFSMPTENAAEIDADKQSEAAGVTGRMGQMIAEKFQEVMPSAMMSAQAN